MRTFDEIILKLREELNSPVWSNLKRGLLGQELINLAAHAVFNSDKGYSIFYRNFFPDTADLKGLLFQSVFHRVPITNYRPAFLKIKMPNDGGAVYPPYTLVLNAGALQYTNIDYVKGSTDDTVSVATFYQGKVKCITDISQSNLIDFGFRNVEYVQKSSTNHKVMTVDPSDLRTQLILPKYAFPQSLKVFLTSSQDPAQELTGVNANPSTHAYMQYTDLDETLRLVFGNGLTCAPISLTDSLAVYFLELSFSQFNNSFVEISYPTGSGLSAYTLNESEIVSQYDGVDESIEAARSSLVSGIAKHSTIATRSQIIDFCRTSPEIIDVVISSVVPSTNTVYIKVKPRVQGDISFDGLESDLQLYGELVTQYDVKAAESVQFKVAIQTATAPSQSAKTSVEDRINDAFRYDKIMFKQPISEASITSLIKDLLEFIPFSVRLKILQKIASGDQVLHLDLAPTESSVKIYNGNNLYAWDRDGRIVGFLGTSLLNYSNVFEMGDFALLKEVDGTQITYKIYNPLTGFLTGISSLENLQKVTCFREVAFAYDFLESSATSLLSFGVYPLIGWRLSDMHNVTQTSTALVRDLTIQVPQQGNFPQAFRQNFNYMYFNEATGLLYLPNTISGINQLNVFQLTEFNTLKHVANYTLGIDESVSPISTFRVHNWVVFQFNNGMARAVPLTEVPTLPITNSTARVVTIANSGMNIANVFKAGSKIAYQKEDGTFELWNLAVGSGSPTTFTVSLLDKLFDTSNVPVIPTEGLKVVSANDILLLASSGRIVAVRGEDDFIETYNTTDITTLKDVGVISYLQRVIQFDNPLVGNDYNLSYQASDSLSELTDKYAYFESIGGVEWEVI